MDHRFYNARILTMEDGQEVFEGELWTEGERISFVGSADAAKEKLAKENVTFREETDCKGDLLMPGFKDAHTHSAMCLMRSAADDVPLQEWLNTQIFPLEAKMTGDDIYELTRLSVLEYLTSGITACMEMYLTPETIAAAARDTGFRCVQVGAMNDFSQSPEMIEEVFSSINGKDPYNSYLPGFHAEYTTSKERLLALSEIAKRLKAPVWTHISETKTEVEGCIERHGKTPVAYLAGLGLFDNGGGGYHLVHVTDEDIQILKEKNMYAVTNPASNLKLASGIAPVASFVKAKVPVAIGTDGPASNNCLDMFREMFLTAALPKVKENDAASLDAGEVLKMATVNGAHAMGLKDSDVLAEGKYADLIRIDMHKPNMQPVNNIVKNLVYSGSKDNVKMTMIGGIIRYRDGNFDIGADPEELYAKAAEIRRRITG